MRLPQRLSVDQSAAFDCVLHSTLMEKLHLYGLDTHACSWIESYLKNRSSYVAIGSAISWNSVLAVWSSSGLGPRTVVISLLCQRFSCGCGRRQLHRRSTPRRNKTLSEVTVVLVEHYRRSRTTACTSSQESPDLEIN